MLTLENRIERTLITAFKYTQKICTPQFLEDLARIKNPCIVRVQYYWVKSVNVFSVMLKYFSCYLVEHERLIANITMQWTLPKSHYSPESITLKSSAYVAFYKRY